MESSCKNCQFWKDKDRVTGYCTMVESDKNTKFTIEDQTAYRPALLTRWDFYCNLHILHKDVHLAGSDV